MSNERDERPGERPVPPAAAPDQRDTEPRGTTGHVGEGVWRSRTRAAVSPPAAAAAGVSAPDTATATSGEPTSVNRSTAVPLSEPAHGHRAMAASSGESMHAARSTSTAAAAASAARATPPAPGRAPMGYAPRSYDDDADHHFADGGHLPPSVQQRLYEADRDHRRNRTLLAVLFVAIVIAAAFGWNEWRKRQAADTSSATPTAAAPAPSAPAGPPPIQHPIEPTAETLPALADSDAAITKALGEVVGAGRLADILAPGNNLVRRIVAAVDNAPRPTLPSRNVPLKAAPSQFMVSGTGEARSIDPRNALRYAIYGQVVEQVDAQKFVAQYRRHYPLFQQAYEELGYPGRYFNDRLVEVIDHLLATPDAPAAPKLVQPKILYEYADPRFESLSAGQKALLRMGPAEVVRVKAKLREIRAGISAPVPATKG